MCRCYTNLDDGVPSTDAGGESVLASVEFDLADQGDVTLANGAQLLVSTDDVTVPFVVGGSAAAATWALQQGIGLRMVANATNGQFDSAAQTAPHLYVLASTLWTIFDIDASADVLVRAYASALQFTTPNVAPGGLSVGVWGVGGSPSGSSNRFRGMRRGNLAGTQGVSNIADAAAGTAIASTSNVIGILNAPAAVQSLHAAFDTDFDTTHMDELAAQDAASNNSQAFRSSGMRYAVGFASRNANADMAVTLRRLRFDFRRAAA